MTPLLLVNLGILAGLLISQAAGRFYHAAHFRLRRLAWRAYLDARGAAQRTKGTAEAAQHAAQALRLGRRWGFTADDPRVYVYVEITPWGLRGCSLDGDPVPLPWEQPQKENES